MADKKKAPKVAPKPVETDDEELVEENDDDETVEEGGEDEVIEEGDAEETPAKATTKKGGNKQGNPGNLVPREPVKVPSSVLKEQSKEVRELLKKREELQAAGDKKGLRKVRAALRKTGFRLSNLPGGQLQKKEKPAEETTEE